MSARGDYEHGVPCWVDTTQPDPGAAVEFYGQVFGWQFEGPGPNEYFVARLDGAHDVAGVLALPDGTPPQWNTYVAVDDVDAVAARVAAAGGSVATAPFDVLPAGRMAVFADPAGATFCGWQAAERQGAQRVNEFGAWAMSQLFTPDPDASAEFYGAVFGWTTESFQEGVWMFRLPGYVGGEPQQPVSREVVAVLVAAPAGPARWSVDFWVEDADATVARASAGGGSVIAPPSDSPVGRSAMLADPSGASFSISRVRAPA